MKPLPAFPGTFTSAIVLFALASAPANAQFDTIEVPPQMAALDFMIGEWQVEGRFRQPDLVGNDRTLWYTTVDGGVTSFNGRQWTAFAKGVPVADSIRARIERRAEPFAFTNAMSTRRAQDGFMLIIDEGRTSGTNMIYYDTAASEWVATSIHAATSAMTVARATVTTDTPVFEGRGTDRRGERIFRRRFVIHSPDHFTIHTDVSFDEGVTWIDDQIVQDVTRTG